MRWQHYAGIGAVFALGGVAGGLLGITAERDRVRKVDREGRLPALEAIAKRLEDELKLDPAQAHRVKEVYSAARPQLLQMERERRRQLRQLMEHTQPAIMEVLTPRQRERFLQLDHKLRLRLRLREPNKELPPGNDPPPTPRT